MARHAVTVLMVPSNNDRYPFTPASIGGLPTVAIPAGTDEDGVPVGVAFFAMPDTECELFALASTIAAAGPSLHSPPEFRHD